MEIAAKIFERATFRGFADYMQFGCTSHTDKRDYETRLDEAYREFEKIALKYDSDRSSDLLASATNMACENADVYFEIGLRAGILFITDMMQDIQGKQNGKSSEAVCGMSMDKNLDGILQEVRGLRNSDSEESVLQQFVQIRMRTAVEESLRQNKKFQDLDSKISEKMGAIDKKGFTSEQRKLIEEVLSENSEKVEEYEKIAYQQGMLDVFNFLKELCQ